MSQAPKVHIKKFFSAARKQVTAAKQKSNYYSRTQETLEKPPQTSQLFGAVLVWIRVADFMTDWAFYCLSVQAPRFQYVMEREGLSYSSFEASCLAFCILASIGFLPDIYGFYQKRVGTCSACVPLARAALGRKCSALGWLNVWVGHDSSPSAITLKSIRFLM